MLSSLPARGRRAPLEPARSAAFPRPRGMLDYQLAATELAWLARRRTAASLTSTRSPSASTRCCP